MASSLSQPKVSPPSSIGFTGNGKKMNTGHMSTVSTIGDVLARRAARDPDATAIACSGLQPLSFGDLARAIRQVGVQLRAAGIGPASRVGIALPRGPEAALLSIAVCCTATVLPINPNLPPADLRAELERIRLDALIVPADAGLPDWTGAADDGVGLFKATRAVSSFDEIALEQVRPLRRRRPASPVTAQSWAAIFRTSGTTGTSKRVPVTHENLVEMARKMERWLKLTPADRSACIMPIHYNAGFKATLLAPLLIGCSVALPTSTSPDDFDKWLVELRPTWLTAAPAVPAGSRREAAQAANWPKQHAGPCAALRAVDSLLSARGDARRARAPARRADRGVLRSLRSRHDDRAGALAGNGPAGSGRPHSRRRACHPRRQGSLSAVGTDRRR